MEEFEIFPVKTLEDSVHQGGLVLDHYRPGWELTVRESMLPKGNFNMGEWQFCMAGQIELYTKRQVKIGGYEVWDDVISFNGLWFSVSDPRTKWIGFQPLHYWEDIGCDESYEILDRLWREQVNMRVVAGEAAPE